MAVPGQRRNDAGRGDLADAVVVRIGDIYVALAVDGDAMGVGELGGDGGTVVADQVAAGGGIDEIGNIGTRGGGRPAAAWPNITRVGNGSWGYPLSGFSGVKLIKFSSFPIKKLDRRMGPLRILTVWMVVAGLPLPAAPLHLQRKTPGRSHVLVKMDRRPDAARLEDWNRRGIRVAGYVPPAAVVLSVPDGAGWPSRA